MSSGFYSGKDQPVKVEMIIIIIIIIIIINTNFVGSLV